MQAQQSMSERHCCNAIDALTQQRTSDEEVDGVAADEPRQKPGRRRAAGLLRLLRRLVGHLLSDFLAKWSDCCCRVSFLIGVSAQWLDHHTQQQQQSRCMRILDHSLLVLLLVVWSMLVVRAAAWSRASASVALQARATAAARRAAGSAAEISTNTAPGHVISSAANPFVKRIKYAEFVHCVMLCCARVAERNRCNQELAPAEAEGGDGLRACGGRQAVRGLGAHGLRA